MGIKRRNALGQLLLVVLVIFIGRLHLGAENIWVKYRDTAVDVSNGNFQHLRLKSSSLVKDMHYDSDNQYLLVQLNQAYYHYCGIPAEVVEEWIQSQSLGRYYNYYVKGNFDCRVNYLPKYK